jgi:protein-disulfide isomerase
MDDQAPRTRDLPVGETGDLASGEHVRHRRRRQSQLGGVVTLVAMGIAVLVATSGARNAPVVVRGPNGAVALVDSMIGGVPQHANMLGSPTAPLTLDYFGDLECPYCREFTLGALPTIIKKWVRTGELRIVYRSMETATREPQVFRTQQVAALAAGRQNKMWYFLELFYHEQGQEDSGYVTERYLQGLAEQVPGLNLAQWISDRNEPALANEVEADKRVARHAGLRGTPGLYFGTSVGTLKLYNSPSLTNPAGFDKVIENLLATQ